MEEHVKQKVSDYIAEYLVQAGIRQGFTVTGGGAMHLNHSFGCQPGLSMLYQHHEQACAMKLSTRRASRSWLARSARSASGFTHRAAVPLPYATRRLK